MAGESARGTPIASGSDVKAPCSPVDTSPSLKTGPSLQKGKALCSESWAGGGRQAVGGGLSALSSGASGPRRGTPPGSASGPLPRRMCQPGAWLGQGGAPPRSPGARRGPLRSLQAPDWVTGEDLPSGVPVPPAPSPALPNQDQMMPLTYFQPGSGFCGL